MTEPETLYLNNTYCIKHINYSITKSHYFDAHTCTIHSYLKKIEIIDYSLDVLCSIITL